jgi:hypothetical protein
MNYLILVGLLLFFVVTELRDAAGWWNFGNGSMSFRISGDDYALRIEGEGQIDLAADGSGVTALDEDGSLDVRMTRTGTTGRVVFSSAGGAAERQFFVDGDERPWSPDADRFVAEVMPIVLRETAFNASERVAWLLENGGHDALLREIELIESDFAQRVYTVEYAQTTEISDGNFERLMRMAGDRMSSDFDLRTTLTEVYDSAPPTAERLAALLAAGETLGSDFDARTLLEHVGPRMPSTSEAVAAYLEVAATIGSDFDLRLALSPLVKQTTQPDDVIATAIELAGAQIDSDFDLRTLLSEAASRVGTSDALALAYTRAAGSLASDFDHREALTALAREAQLGPRGWESLLESAQNIGSDFDCATLLASVAPDLPSDDAVVAAYRATLQTIGNDFDRGRAAAALIDVRQ